MKSLISVSYFSLACMYLLALVQSSIRFFAYKVSAMSPIVKLLYLNVITLCLVRLGTFVLAAILMTSNAYFYKYLLSN